MMLKTINSVFQGQLIVIIYYKNNYNYYINAYHCYYNIHRPPSCSDMSSLIIRYNVILFANWVAIFLFLFLRVDTIDALYHS